MVDVDSESLLGLPKYSNYGATDTAFDVSSLLILILCSNSRHNNNKENNNDKANNLECALFAIHRRKIYILSINTRL